MRLPVKVDLNGDSNVLRLINGVKGRFMDGALGVSDVLALIGEAYNLTFVRVNPQLPRGVVTTSLEDNFPGLKNVCFCHQMVAANCGIILCGYFSKKKKKKKKKRKEMITLPTLGRVRVGCQI